VQSKQGFRRKLSDNLICLGIDNPDNDLVSIVNDVEIQSFIEAIADFRKVFTTLRISECVFSMA